jgi:hypothetical protein
MNEIATGNWANFFVAEVGASAALTGLVVVAVSINLSRILAFPHLPGRAAEALFMLGGVLVLTSAALVPHQPMAFFGIETLAVGLVMFSAPLVIQMRWRKAGADIPKLRRSIRVISSAAPGLFIAVAGLSLTLDWSAGLDLIAAGVILSLVAGVLTTWVLLVEILR